MGCWLSGSQDALAPVTRDGVYSRILDLGSSLWRSPPQVYFHTKKELIKEFRQIKCPIMIPGITELMADFLSHNVRFDGTNGNIEIKNDGLAVESFGKPKGGTNTWGENFVYSTPLPKGDHGVFELSISIDKEHIHTPDMGIGVIRRRVLQKELSSQRGNIIRIGKFFCLYPASNHQVLTAESNFDSNFIYKMPRKSTLMLRLDYDKNTIEYTYNGRTLARALQKKFGLREQVGGGVGSGKDADDFLFAVAFKNAGDSVSIR